ncbi:MAG: hypothetical protein OXF60_12110 [Gammaproteobacteria bacterium]|nr:hypothetical protein [Gammaproteobacteria bacterium]
MEALGFLAVIAFLVGVACLVRPIKAIRIPTRRRATAVMGFSFVVITVVALSTNTQTTDYTERVVDSDAPASTTLSSVQEDLGAESATPAPADVLTPVDVDVLTCPDPVNVHLDYRDKVQIRRIASDIVKQWGLKAGSMDVLPEDKSRNFFWILNADAAMHALASNSDWTWYRDGNMVRFVKRDDPVLKTAGIVAAKFKLSARKVDGGLSISVNSDLGDRQTISVLVRRLYRAKSESGKVETYSSDYGKYCGLAAQWRTTKLLPVDDKEWKADLQKHQDKMAPLGPDMAFEIESIEGHIMVKAHARGSDDEVAVISPLRVSVQSRSSFVGDNYLRLWESYETLKGVPLIARSTYPNERGTLLTRPSQLV